MQNFESILKYVGNLTSKNNMAYNILVWMIFTTSIVDPNTGNLQRIQFTGDPQTVFQTANYHASLYDKSNTCPVDSLVTFDPMMYTLTLSYNKTKYESDSVCSSLLNSSLVIDPFFEKYDIVLNNFDFIIDIRSFLVAVSVFNYYSINLIIEIFFMINCCILLN